LSNYVVSDTSLTAVADAIREKGGTSGTLAFPDGFVSAVEAIETGITPSGTIQITENGTVDVTNYASAEVDVESAGADTIQESLDFTRSGDVVYTKEPRIDTSVLDLYYGLFYKCPITSLVWNATTRIPPYIVRECKQLQTATFYGTSLGDSMCYQSNIQSVSLPEVSVEKTNYVYRGDSAFHSCHYLTSVSMPLNPTIHKYMFGSCDRLPMLDCPAVTRIRTNAFWNCSALTVLILRADSVCTLEHVNAFTGTPFASGGAGGTIYVPSALISDYQAATNWSTIDGYGATTWAAIEGSEYEE